MNQEVEKVEKTKYVETIKKTPSWYFNVMVLFR